MATEEARASIGARLERVARRVPERIAIIEGERSVSYAALDEATRAIARRIHLEGARPGFVALLFEGKIPAIEAKFGASRCARAYVALDAGDPDERLRLIVADSEPVVLLTENTLLARARALAPAGCSVIAIEDIEPGGPAIALPEPAPDSWVNLYYTSGSTGVPKGVAQTHANVLYFADAYARTLSMRETDRVSLLYTMSFGASVLDVCAALFNGATLCAYDVRRDGVGELAGWLGRERVSVLHTVPTVFRGLFASLEDGASFEHLRAIDLGGETVFDTDAALFLRHTRPGCIFVNHLAATECNIIAQHVVGHGGERPAEGILPVGKSPEGVSVLVRREDGSEAAPGEVGDLIVRSVHLSPGYWRRPELAAAAFSADPLNPSARRYFTGDLGYVDEAGALHFLGRKGSRVKIRGQSIDLSEVEAALAACPGVVKSAVVAINAAGSPEADRLAAYLVASDRAPRDPLLVRAHLAQRLPPYMLPGAFVFVDALPLTATGKIDRAALAALEPPHVDPSRVIDPPRDEVERAVAALFEQLLKRAPIGRDDDFFLLGGDSLSLVELQARILDRFGASLSKFYEDATVAGIAATIRRARNTTGAVEPLPVLFPIKESGSAPPIFIIHGRLGQPFVSPHFVKLLGDDLPVWAFQARGLDGLHEPNRTIEAMAADYLAEMKKRRPNGPYFIAALCAGALIANAMARSLRDAGDAVLPLLLFDPPERKLRASVAEEDLLLRIQARQAEGQFVTPIDDPRYASAAVRTARAFEDAIWDYQPRPYAGPVYMLSSQQRMTDADSIYLKRLFPGAVERFEVGSTHTDSLDPRNPVFAARLAYCLTRILAAAESGAPSAHPRSAASADPTEAATGSV